ncbi:unnamed protein product, partial [Iphiclides podalirius]
MHSHYPLDYANQAVNSEMWTYVDSGGGEGRAAPCSRGKHSATLLGGYLYLLGGRGAGGSVPLRDFWRFSLATGQWERLECRGDAPPALQEHTATAHENRLYVFGGEAGSSSSETPLWIYDTELEVWRKLAGQVRCGSRRRRGANSGAGAGGSTPAGRRAHSAHPLPDCLLLYGGYMDLRGSTNELWAFHYESETWRQVRALRAGPARHRHAAALLGDRLYVHGGQCDLRDCGDLWHYDIVSRVWTAVRGSGRAAPSARSGHAGLRAGAHLYIFGGEARGHATNEMWRFHFATESWERIEQSAKWPSARADSRALLVGGAGGGGGAAAAAGAGRVRSAVAPRGVARRPEPPAGFLREISKLSGLRLRRAARCSYTALAGERDSTESLPKSRSAHVFADSDESPAEADEAEPRRDLSRGPLSVPDFADVALPAPKQHAPEARIVKSASVRFGKAPGADDEAELSTSDYASAEKVNGSGAPSLGFSNPHYLGPDVRSLGMAMTPDSGMGAADIELQELGERRARSEPRGGNARLHLLLVGGKEPPHLALLQSPLSMWTYRLL